MIKRIVNIRIVDHVFVIKFLVIAIDLVFNIVINRVIGEFRL